MINMPLRPDFQLDLLPIKAAQSDGVGYGWCVCRYKLSGVTTGVTTSTVMGGGLVISGFISIIANVYQEVSGCPRDWVVVGFMPNPQTSMVNTFLVTLHATCLL
jgi:hypothetical protein